VSHPTEIFETQNVRDDDGEVIDSFFKEVDNPPDLKELQSPIVVKALIEPKPITRFISGEVIIAPSWTVIQLLPADANRKNFTLKVYSPTAVATDGIRMSDENGNILTSGKILHGDDISTFEHTGPVYVIGCGNGTNGAASAPVSLNFWSITT
jgi:hypothetical protein